MRSDTQPLSVPRETDSDALDISELPELLSNVMSIIFQRVSIAVVDTLIAIKEVLRVGSGARLRGNRSALTFA